MELCPDSGLLLVGGIAGQLLLCQLECKKVSAPKALGCTPLPPVPTLTRPSLARVACRTLLLVCLQPNPPGLRRPSDGRRLDGGRR